MKAFLVSLALPLVWSIPSYAACPTAMVIIKGRVENAPQNAIVRMQLLYLRDQASDSGDVTVESGRFTLKVPFYTQSRGPSINGLFEKCNRKPKGVIVSLIVGDHEYDRVSLDFSKDFTDSIPERIRRVRTSC
jgi:hypothetical protein